MATLTKTVTVAKETDEAMAALVGLVKAVKAKKDVSSIFAEEFPLFVQALDGVDKVPAEFKDERPAAFRAVALRAEELVEALLAPAPAPTPVA